MVVFGFAKLSRVEYSVYVALMAGAWAYGFFFVVKESSSKVRVVPVKLKSNSNKDLLWYY